VTIQPGTRLGPYEIAAAIGAGRMGKVYRARDTRLGRDVAIKTCPSTSPPPQLLQRALDRPDFTAVPGTEESSNPFISPAGGWVGFQSHSQLKKVSFSGGVSIPICDLPGPLGGAAWLEDGTIVGSSAPRRPTLA
jgi:hypothetical protein